MKRVQEHIEVRTRGNRPHIIRWRRRLLDVRQVLDFWVIEGRWWSAEERRVYFRVSTSTGAVMDIYRRDNEWYLASLVD